MSPGRACRSGRSARQPRSSTSESEQRTAVPHRARRENAILSWGGAALIRSSAAYSRVCSPLGMLAARVTRVVTLLILFAGASSASVHDNIATDSSQTVLFSAFLDV